MKHIKYSLARRFIYLMGIFIAAFLVSAALLLYSFYELNRTYTIKTEELENKERLAEEIGQIFNDSVSSTRGFIAYGNKDLIKAALAGESQIRELTTEFREITTNNKDQDLINQVDIFTDYYFVSILPQALEDYDNNNVESVIQIGRASCRERVYI